MFCLRRVLFHRAPVEVTRFLGSRLSCTQVSLHRYGSTADTFRQSNSLCANSLRDGADHLSRARVDFLPVVDQCVGGFTEMHYREETNADPLHSVLLSLERLLFCRGSFFTRRRWLCRFCGDGCDAHRWSLVGNVLKAFQLMSLHTALRRNSVPMKFLILENSPASQRSFRPPSSSHLRRWL